MTASEHSTLDRAEIGRFAALADQWWDPKGKFRPLHALNPVRVGYIRDRIAEAQGRDPDQADCLRGLAVLDVGCGGGLVAEPMARLGATVTGLDAGAEAIAVAQAHARQTGLAIDYRQGLIEDVAAEGRQYQAVTALEIIEHVADPDRFMAALATVLAPGGVLVMSTLNRTAKSYLLAILGAEYVLRWLEPGTHRWRAFVKPHELAAKARAGGLVVRDTAGMVLDPLSGRWALSGRDLDVNYLLCARKPA